MSIYKVKNERFFKKWSPEMAYILGFFTADGSMIKNKRGAHFIEFETIDRDILKKIQKIICPYHKIASRKRSENWSTSYQLQVGSKSIFNDLLSIGLNPRKSRRIVLPRIPKKYFPHFIRGYFDGDGNVTVCVYNRKTRRNKPTRILQSGFVSGSKKFLESIKNMLLRLGIVRGGTLYYSSGAWRLYFSINDSRRLYKYMYNSLVEGKSIFLARKKVIFDKYLGA
ncbi:MAG: LAGLIDADG family homing endonuclease [Candidatus Paceibacterota bacterium]